ALRTGSPRLAPSPAGECPVNHINAPDGTPLVYDAYAPARPGVAVLLLHDWQPQPAGPPPADRFVGLGTRLQAPGRAASFLAPPRGSPICGRRCPPAAARPS